MKDWTDRQRHWRDQIIQLLIAVREDTELSLIERERLLDDLVEEAGIMVGEVTDQLEDDH